MTTTGRRVRGIATVAVLLAVLAGSAWGYDDHFPFGPFRMFSVANRLDGRVYAAEVRAVTESGDLVILDFQHLGLRRAEIEGQWDLIEADPTLLAFVEESYRRFNPDAPRFTKLLLIKEIHRLNEGVPVGYHEEVLAVWEKS